MAADSPACILVLLLSANSSSESPETRGTVLFIDRGVNAQAGLEY